MITEHFTFLSSDKETLIHAVKWLPDSRKYKAILQITHGMTEHILRYEEFAAFLTEHEYMVIGHDHLGHGTTAKRKEDFGYFTKSSPSDHLISDMHTLRITIRKENPNVPYFMMGHSMGSYLLRKYLSLHGESLEGSIIMGTGFVPPVAAVTGLFLIYAVALLKGWRYRSPFITGIMFGKSYKQFDQTGTDFSNSWLTRDAKIVEKNHSDPYTNFKFTLNGYRGLLETVFFDCRYKNIRKISKNLPVFFVSGDQDPVGDLGKGVRKTYDLFVKAGIKDVTIKLYKADRHELVNELDRLDVYSDLMDFMDKRL